MKSIQTKLTMLILAGIVISVFLVGGIGILSAENIIDSSSVQLMNSICNEKAQQLNNTFGRVEQSVDILSNYVIDNFDSVDKLSDETFLNDYMADIENLAYTSVNETEGAVSVYVRINPEIVDDTGFFTIINPETGCFEPTEITDITAYNPDDTEHVGWYYESVKAGKAVWMEPYYNDNINIYMISYVVPVYKDNTFIGVVGMDIDFNYITQATDSIKIYDTGFAFLTDINFNIIHHKNIKTGVSILEFSDNFTDAEKASVLSTDTLFEYTFNNVRKKAAFRMLDNGMCLAAAAPISEIDKNKNELISHIMILALLTMGVFFLIASSIARKIVQSLKEQNNVAQEVANGNLDVKLNCKGKDEVGTLTESAKETVKQLKNRIDYINSLAYTDKLTGLQNNTAYIQAVSEIKTEIEKGTAQFTVAIIDLNGLKYINDNYGHDNGNKFIIAAGEVISQVFGKENVYRTGGDEFAVLLKNNNSSEYYRLEHKFLSRLEEPCGNITVSAAIGFAVYDKSIDECYESVYKRADENMYKCKMEMKTRGETSRVHI